MGSSNRSGEKRKQMAELSKNLKEGERILEPTRRPDGTLRKPIRIRAGHVPEDEVVIYQSKGSLVWSLYPLNTLYSVLGNEIVFRPNLHFLSNR